MTGSGGGQGYGSGNDGGSYGTTGGQGDTYGSGSGGQGAGVCLHHVWHLPAPASCCS